VNAILELLSAHRTIRRFAAGAVPDAEVAAVVSAAQRASTSSHVQAYSLLRVRDAGERARLAELAGGQRQVAEAGAFFVVCAEQRRHRLVAERAGKPLVANLESFLVAVIDASLFAQNLVIGFESLGYGVCCIGGLRNSLPEVDGLLELPPDVFPLFGLCVGVPAERPLPRPRLPLAGVLFEGRYPADDELRAAIDAHDAEMREYYAGRGSPGHDWSGGVSRKLSAAHRPDLPAYYARKGAVLE